jgi:hypothetical protein
VLWLNAVTFSSPWPTFLHIRTDSGMAGSGKYGPLCLCTSAHHAVNATEKSSRGPARRI